MKYFLTYALVLGLSSTRVCAQTGGSALDQLLKQSGHDAAPAVAAIPAAAAVEAGAAAAKTELVLFSKCSGAIPYGDAQVPVALDFYKEHQSGHPEMTTGKGVMNLSLGGGPAIPHALKIVTEDALATKLELYAAFDSQRKFAEFAIPKTEKSQVRIYAIEFRAEWVTVECVR